MGREIYDIINDMAEVLNASQMQKLQEVLVKRLSENTVSDYLQTTNMDFIAKREALAYIANDGKQTPMKGHPVFIAQHATATYCRECIRKWHKMQPGKELSQVQQDYLVDVIMTWIQREMERQAELIKRYDCWN